MRVAARQALAVVKPVIELVRSTRAARGRSLRIASAAGSEAVIVAEEMRKRKIAIENEVEIERRNASDDHALVGLIGIAAPNPAVVIAVMIGAMIAGVTIDETIAAIIDVMSVVMIAATIAEMSADQRADEIGVTNGRVKTTQNEIGVAATQVKTTQKEIGVVATQVKMTQNEIGVVAAPVKTIQKMIGTVMIQVKTTLKKIGVVTTQVTTTRRKIGVVTTQVKTTRSKIGVVTTQVKTIRKKIGVVEAAAGVEIPAGAKVKEQVQKKKKRSLRAQLLSMFPISILDLSLRAKGRICSLLAGQLLIEVTRLRKVILLATAFRIVQKGLAQRKRSMLLSWPRLQKAKATRKVPAKVSALAPRMRHLHHVNKCQCLALCYRLRHQQLPQLQRSVPAKLVSVSMLLTLQPEPLLQYSLQQFTHMPLQYQRWCHRR
jgi:hypothetical protein